MVAKVNCLKRHGRLKLHWNRPQGGFVSGDTSFVLTVENRDPKNII